MQSDRLKRADEEREGRNSSELNPKRCPSNALRFLDLAKTLLTGSV